MVNAINEVSLESVKDITYKTLKICKFCFVLL